MVQAPCTEPPQQEGSGQGSSGFTSNACGWFSARPLAFGIGQGFSFTSSNGSFPPARSPVRNPAAGAAFHRSTEDLRMRQSASYGRLRKLGKAKTGNRTYRGIPPLKRGLCNGGAVFRQKTSRLGVSPGWTRFESPAVINNVFFLCAEVLPPRFPLPRGAGVRLPTTVRFPHLLLLGSLRSRAESEHE